MLDLLPKGGVVAEVGVAFGGFSTEIIDRLNKSAAKAVQSEAFKRLGTNEGLVMVAAPPDALDRYFAGEEERWRKVIQDAAIKIE